VAVRSPVPVQLQVRLQELLPGQLVEPEPQVLDFAQKMM
jgi:hypothetical protein